MTNTKNVTGGRPFFSVLICTVGKEALTRGAIDSILAQSFDDVEIVVTDTTETCVIRELVASYNDPRIVFFDVPNNDPTIAWEFAYEKSTGQYVLWYDDDNRLVPWALTHFARLIEKDGADIVSANHVYYLGVGNRHEPERTNTLSALLPFSLTTRTYDKDHLLCAVYDWRMGTAEMPRWHSAATFVAREICERARQEVGYFIAPYMYGNFTFHPLAFEYAKHPVYDDRPVCVIGKFNTSVTQQWTNTFVNTKRSTAAPYKFTGLSERSLGNTTAECYLRVQHDLPRHNAYPFNWEKFLTRYSADILYTTIPLARHLRAWRELWKATSVLTGRARRNVRTTVLKRAILSMGIRLARAVGIWNTLRPRFKKTLPHNEKRKLIELAQYDAYNIDDCAQKLSTIFEKEWSVQIRT